MTAGQSNSGWKPATAQNTTTLPYNPTLHPQVTARPSHVQPGCLHELDSFTISKSNISQLTLFLRTNVILLQLPMSFSHLHEFVMIVNSDYSTCSDNRLFCQSTLTFNTKAHISKVTWMTERRIMAMEYFMIWIIMYKIMGIIHQILWYEQ